MVLKYSGIESEAAAVVHVTQAPPTPVTALVNKMPRVTDADFDVRLENLLGV